MSRELLQCNGTIVISHAAVEGACEDSYSYSLLNHMAYTGVFDGCGGLGSRRYQKDSSHTGAFIASRVAALSVLEWFENEYSRTRFSSEEAIVDALKQKIDTAMTRARDYLEENQQRVLGKMARNLPTTAAIAITGQMMNDDLLSVRFLWAGDSRGFTLTPEGLVQRTRDDVKSQNDAFENLFDDSPLSNLVNADKDYHLNFRRFKLAQPSIVFVASDGVFGYLPSPMHLELTLLETLVRARSMNEWQSFLEEALVSVTGDDCTLVLQSFGWESFDKMRSDFSARLKSLSAIVDGAVDREALAEIWKVYKAGYYDFKG